MIVRELDIPGALLLVPEEEADRRGYHTRGYARRLLEARGLEPPIVRCAVIVCGERGEVHALRYQEPPDPEAVLLRPTRGAVRLVAVDVRDAGEGGAPGARVELDLATAERRSLYLPGGVAYGFQALEDGAEVFLQTNELERPEQERTLPEDEGAGAVEWPLPVTEVVAVPDPPPSS